MRSSSPSAGQIRSSFPGAWSTQPEGRSRAPWCGSSRRPAAPRDRRGAPTRCSSLSRLCCTRPRMGDFRLPAECLLASSTRHPLLLRMRPRAGPVVLKTAGGLAAAFADVVLHRIRAVDGFVHDRQGKPVEGVTVFQSGDGPMRTRTLTDARGRFRLPGVIAGKAILFARKDGFRFHGQPVDTEAGAADLTLARVEETTPLMKTLDGAARTSGRADGCSTAACALRREDHVQGHRCAEGPVFTVLVQVDPARALELLDASSAGKPQFAVDSLRSNGRYRDGEPEPRRSRQHRGGDPRLRLAIVVS